MTVKELRQIRTNNRTHLDEKTVKILMPSSQSELPTNLRKEQKTQSKKTHTTSHFSTRKMKRTRKIKRDLETRVMRIHLLSSKEYLLDQGPSLAVAGATTTLMETYWTPV